MRQFKQNALPKSANMGIGKGKGDLKYLDRNNKLYETESSKQSCKDDVKAYPEFIVSHFVMPVEVLVLILSITSIPRSTKKKNNQKNKALHAHDSPVYPVGDLLQEFVTAI